MTDTGEGYLVTVHVGRKQPRARVDAGVGEGLQPLRLRELDRDANLVGGVLRAGTDRAVARGVGGVLGLDLPEARPFALVAREQVGGGAPAAAVGLVPEPVDGGLELLLRVVGPRVAWTMISRGSCWRGREV